MSTRANYEFYNKNEELEARFYIHSDGYCEGAASYFNNALIYNNGSTYEIENAFFRANKNCEMSGQLHGDIEYIYKYRASSGKLTVYQTNFEVDNPSLWLTVFSGTIYEFVNKYFTVFNSDIETYSDCLYGFDNEEKQEQKIKKFNKWVNGESLASNYKKLVEEVASFKGHIFNMTNDNPNIKNDINNINELINKLVNSI